MREHDRTVEEARVGVDKRVCGVGRWREFHKATHGQNPGSRDRLVILRDTHSMAPGGTGATCHASDPQLRPH